MSRSRPGAFATAIALLSIAAIAGNAVAANNDKPDKGAKQEKKAHKHKHNSGHAALGAKLKVNGKHAVGKIANKTVSAEVRNGKVVNMDAEGLAAKRVKTKQKMAALEGGVVVADSGAFHFVQDSGYYYGYCFDDGYGGYECYWYPEEDVDTGGEWDEYDPYY